MKRLSSSLLTIACVISFSHPMVNAQENLPSQESDKCTSHSTAENYPEDSGRKATAGEKEIIQKGLLDGTIPHIADTGKVNVNKTLTVEKITKPSIGFHSLEITPILITSWSTL